MGVQRNVYTQFLRRATSTTRLRAATPTQQEAEEWIQLDHNLKYVLMQQQLIGPWDLQVTTCTISDYLTKLLEPTFDSNNLEESFRNWEYDVQQYKSDNNAQVTDQVKVAVLMNRTRGPLRQHLNLNAGASSTYAEIRTTITEYQRAYTTFRLQQNPSSPVCTN